MTLKLSFASLFSLIFTIAWSQGGISVDYSKVYFQQEPGEIASQTINISNPTDEDLYLDLKLMDWKRDIEGKKEYSTAGSLASSCANWIEFSPQNTFIPANGSLQLTIHMQVPDDYPMHKGVANAMLMLKQNKPFKYTTVDENALKSQINVLFQMGIHIYYTPPVLQRKGLEINNYWHEKNLVNLDLTNIGDVILDSQIEVEVVNQNTGAIFKLTQEARKISFLPNDRRILHFELLKDLPSGKYAAMAVVDIGADEDLEVATMEFEFKNSQIFTSK